MLTTFQPVAKTMDGGGHPFIACPWNGMSKSKSMSAPYFQRSVLLSFIFLSFREDYLHGCELSPDAVPAYVKQ